MAMYDDEREVTYEIVEELGEIAERSSTGWVKELNLVSWNGGPAKYDIREWSPQHNQMSRGITLTEMEMRRVVELLRRRTRGNSRRAAQNPPAEREPQGWTRTEDEPQFEAPPESAASAQTAASAQQ